MTETIKKKKRVNGKAKGSGFERSIANTLSTVLAPLNFKRTQQSGAIVGGLNGAKAQQYSQESLSLFVGDIAPVNEQDVFLNEGWKLRFSIECKFYKSPDNIQHLLDNTRIRGWFEQACRDAAKINKEPILIFKFNHTDTFVAIDSSATFQPPSTITKSMILIYAAEGDMPARTINIFNFKDALNDIQWWKDIKKLNALDKARLIVEKQFEFAKNPEAVENERKES